MPAVGENKKKKNIQVPAPGNCSGSVPLLCELGVVVAPNLQEALAFGYSGLAAEGELQVSLSRDDGCVCKAKA